MSRRVIGSLTDSDLGRPIRFVGGPWRVLASVRHYTTPDDARCTSVLHRDPADDNGKGKGPKFCREINAPSDTPCEVPA